MNYIKLQQDLLKDFLKEKIKRCMFFEEDGYVHILPDGIVVYRIPKCCWLLDGEWIKKNFPSSLTLKKLYNENDCRPAVATGAYKKNDDRTLMVIENEHFTVYIDKVFMKYFKDPTFMVKNNVSPVGVYEGKELVGVVCPAKVKVKE